jgi:hypothetical protein
MRHLRESCVPTLNCVPVYCRFKPQALDLIKRNVCFGVMTAKMGVTVGEFLSFESVLGKVEYDAIGRDLHSFNFTQQVSTARRDPSATSETRRRKFQYGGVTLGSSSTQRTKRGCDIGQSDLYQ